MSTPLEKLSLIASSFAVAVDPLADGNRAADARQTIRDVLAGHLVHVVSAETYAARCVERDAARARLAEVEAAHARRLSLANDEALAVDAHVRDLESKLLVATADLARVKAEAEGLRALLGRARNHVDATWNRACSLPESYAVIAEIGAVVEDIDAALASPTPAHVVNHPNGDGTSADYAEDPDAPAMQDPLAPIDTEGSTP